MRTWSLFTGSEYFFKVKKVKPVRTFCSEKGNETFGNKNIKRALWVVIYIPVNEVDAIFFLFRAYL